MIHLGVTILPQNCTSALANTEVKEVNDLFFEVIILHLLA
jgi:hypothetical protein